MSHVRYLQQTKYYYHLFIDRILLKYLQNRRAKWRKSERLKEDQRKRDGSDHIGDDDKVL